MSIYVKLFGGIGNQMFQYAAGRSLSVKLDTALKLDVSAYKDYPDREYRLHEFPIEATVTDAAELEELYYDWQIDRSTFTGKLRRKILPWYRQRIIRQGPRMSATEFNSIRQSCYLDGYWQSETYFLQIIPELKREFTFPAISGPSIDVMHHYILEAGARSVSIHVRRGDYVNNPEVRRVHGVLDLDYYNRAMTKIEETVDEPVYFIFSDEPEWAKRHLSSEFRCHFIDDGSSDGSDQTGSDIRDLFLMSRCHHHIIANSSFSWWGAWLGESPGSVIITPRQWFAPEILAMTPVADLIPTRWIKQ